jgi:hypothetical protein
MCSWRTFGARTNHEQTRTHKTRHGPDLGEATTFALIVFSMPGHGAYAQMSFCLGTPKLGVLKFSKLGLLQLWRPIPSCLDLWLRWDIKKNCSPCRELFNDMLYATCTQVNQGNSWLLVVRNQIWFLTLLLAITYVLNTQMGHASPF